MSISISGCAISSHNETISARAGHILTKAHDSYNRGHYLEALSQSETLYELDAFRTDNLLLLGAIHFQLRNFSESIFYNQQCIRVDPNFAESYSNLGNALKELGDLAAAAQFYLKVRNERVIHLVTSVEFFYVMESSRRLFISLSSYENAIAPPALILFVNSSVPFFSFHSFFHFLLCQGNKAKTKVFGRIQ